MQAGCPAQRRLHIDADLFQARVCRRERPAAVDRPARERCGSAGRSESPLKFWWSNNLEMSGSSMPGHQNGYRGRYRRGAASVARTRPSPAGRRRADAEPCGHRPAVTLWRIGFCWMAGSTSSPAFLRSGRMMSNFAPSEPTDRLGTGGMPRPGLPPRPLADWRTATRSWTGWPVRTPCRNRRREAWPCQQHRSDRMQA